MSSVLVIDDEQMIRDLLQQALGTVGLKVETADNVKRGMVKFDTGLYDLVITDVRKPGVDGRLVLHHVRRSRRSTTPVIGLSGTPWLLHNGGFDGVLDKPFTIRKLIHKATSLIERESLRETA